MRSCCRRRPLVSLFRTTPRNSVDLMCCGQHPPAPAEKPEVNVSDRAIGLFVHCVVGMTTGVFTVDCYGEEPSRKSIILGDFVRIGQHKKCSHFLNVLDTIPPPPPTGFKVRKVFQKMISILNLISFFL